HIQPVGQRAADQVGRAGVGHPDLAAHLAADDLDVLVVDLHALQAVDLLDLADEVVMDGVQALDRQDVLGIQDALAGDDVALLDPVAGHDPGVLGEGDGVALDHLGAGVVLAGDLDDHVLLGIVLRDDARDLAHDGHALGPAALEQLLDAGQTLGDVLRRGNAAGVEGTHGQLGARLADGLGRDDADRLAQLDRLAGGHVGAVAACADAGLGAAGQQAADLQVGDAGSLDLL